MPSVRPQEVDAVTLKIQVYDSFVPLIPLRDRWDQLGEGIVFRSFDWLHLWWQHYGQLDSHRELHVVVVSEMATHGENIVAIAPWYLERSLPRGTVIRWLGSGEVCSDHLTLLTEPGREAEVARLLADHLVGDLAWDQLLLDAVDDGDAAVGKLASALARRHCAIRQRNTGNCWVIDLPGDWESFLALQSKSHRKQLRQSFDRVLATPRAVWRQATSHEDLARGWKILVDLHQRRRQSLGEPGCFASVRFSQFHREMAQQLMATGKLRLSWLELDGVPAAAEYHFAGPSTTYAYQGGVDPSRLAEEPGRLSNIATIRQTMSEGHTRFDFLRGDEPYKAHWRATPRSTYTLDAVAPNTAARWRATSFDWAAHVASRVRSRFGPLVTSFRRS